MFEIIESIRIDRPPERVWQTLRELERWWPPSNPEHIRIDVHSDDKSIEEGTRISFEERVAGIPCIAEGRITRLLEGREATWEGDAVYRWVGLRLPIREGVCWTVEHDLSGSKLSARVWAVFPSSLFGWIAEHVGKSLLRVVQRDREHARRELEYLKAAVESSRREN